MVNMVCFNFDRSVSKISEGSSNVDVSLFMISFKF